MQSSGDSSHLHDSARVEPREQWIVQSGCVSLPAKRRGLGAIDADDEKSIAEIQVTRDNRANRVSVCAADGKNCDADFVAQRIVVAADKDTSAVRRVLRRGRRD